MKREPVSSSSLAEIGYDVSTQTMEICFKSGRIYQYFDVPQVIYDELRTAESPGGYLSTRVKGEFRYARV